jgi:hypothetical protein
MTASVRHAFEQYRASRQGRGLAWWLAAELCERFHASHGIVPHVIEHEGLGYYGIQLDLAACPVNPTESEPLGRLTAGGDVENWRTGSPGDHGLPLSERERAGESLDGLLGDAIRHLDWPVRPERSHAGCRHKRRGASFTLVFEIVALLALRHDERIRVRNHPALVGDLARKIDSDSARPEYPGLLVVETMDGRRVAIAGDGRMLRPRRRSLWEQYMQGQSPEALAGLIERGLGLEGESGERLVVNKRRSARGSANHGDPAKT